MSDEELKKQAEELFKDMILTTEEMKKFRELKLIEKKFIKNKLNYKEGFKDGRNLSIKEIEDKYKRIITKHAKKIKHLEKIASDLYTDVNNRKQGKKKKECEP